MMWMNFYSYGVNFMQIYAVYFDTEIMKMNAEVLKLTADTSDALDKEIYHALNATGYDFFDYSDEIAILVDDQGFFKQGLPVFEIESTYGDVNKLVGKLLFVRNIETEYSVDIGSIIYEDIFKLRNELKIQFVGFTKGA